MFDFIGKIVFITVIFVAGDIYGFAGLKQIVLSFLGG